MLCSSSVYVLIAQLVERENHILKFVSSTLTQNVLRKKANINHCLTFPLFNPAFISDCQHVHECNTVIHLIGVHKGPI